MQAAIAKNFPAIGYKYNYFPDKAILDQPPNELLLTADERSKHDLPKDILTFFKEHGALEQKRSAGPLPPAGLTRLLLHKLVDTMVLGSTGSTVIKAQNRQVEAAAPNNMRFAQLTDRTIETAAINMLGMAVGHRHYYHFLADAAYPLMFLLEHLEPRTFPLTLLVRENLPEFQRAFYRHLLKKTPLLQLEECKANERIHCQTLYHCLAQMNSEFRVPPSEQAASMIAAHYLSAYNLQAVSEPTLKLYIARDDAKTRKILNEKFLKDQLEARGFHSIIPGTLGHEDQVQLFNEAKIIVGTHGAGLTNLLFSQAGGKVIEIFPADYIQSAYAWIAHLRGLSYAPVIGEESGAHQHFSLSQKAIGQILDEIDAHGSV
ncbi:hypothetical protein GCM10007094_07410 [Pseudovibrio japonicus]|uniref:Glycosyltransferase 61 catalytic domain-containing protein n=2 Tax=Pseudovibrio japonicus TaxID=366534 RepID=A0ABQ3E353_9HYPH|nr:hypothetical protein GCM10007094_07410 [Pseudovibrio japonicus]